MQLFYNLSDGALSLNLFDRANTTVNLPIKAGQDVPLLIQSHRDGVPELLPAGSSPLFGIKAFGLFEGPYLASAAVWTAPSDPTGSYSATLTTDTTAIRTALNINNNPADDLASVPQTICEFQFTPPGAVRPIKSQTISCRLDNYVNQGSEVAPSNANPPYPPADQILPVVHPVLNTAARLAGTWRLGDFIIEAGSNAVWTATCPALAAGQSCSFGIVGDVSQDYYSATANGPTTAAQTAQQLIADLNNQIDDGNFSVNPGFSATGAVFTLTIPAQETEFDDAGGLTITNTVVGASPRAGVFEVVNTTGQNTETAYSWLRSFSDIDATRALAQGALSQSGGNVNGNLALYGTNNTAPNMASAPPASAASLITRDSGETMWGSSSQAIVLQGKLTRGGNWVPQYVPVFSRGGTVYNAGVVVDGNTVTLALDTAYFIPGSIANFINPIFIFEFHFAGFSSRSYRILKLLVSFSVTGSGRIWTTQPVYTNIVQDIVLGNIGVGTITASAAGTTDQASARLVLTIPISGNNVGVIVSARALDSY